MSMSTAFSPMRRRLLQRGLCACGSLFLVGRAETSAAMDALMPEQGHHHHHAMPSQSDGYMRSRASYRIPDVNLVDRNGVTQSLIKVLDDARPVMLNFIFTTCGAICPIMSATFAKMQAALDSEGNGLHMVSISIDPEYDTPEVLKAYAKRFGAGDHWQMLTGSLDNSIRVQRAFDVYRGNKMNHVPLTFLHAKPGQSWMRLEGFASAADLLREYRQLAAK
jgi:protein SCO1/2